MLIAVIADTHLPRGVRRLPGACVDWLGDADLILHAGDLSARSALEELRAFDAPVLAVRGNVDEPSLRRELPERRLVEAEGARIGMLHDAGPRRGRLDRLRTAFPEADAVVFGHSHLPLHEEREGFQILNPGSPTERRRAPNRSMGLANVEHGMVRFELVDLGA